MTRQNNEAVSSGDTEARGEDDQRKTWTTPRVLLSEIERQTNKAFALVDTHGYSPDGPS